MRFMEDEDGKLNNFAVEPKMYKESPQSDDERQKLLIIGIVGSGLVAALIGVTVLVSV